MTVPVTSDRFPTRTGGPYEPPGFTEVGLDVDRLAAFVQREFGKVAMALRGYPAISLNAIPTLWAPGSLLSVASSGTAPASGVRGVQPVAVYGSAVDRIGSVNFRILASGRYRLMLINAMDAPGGGVVRWTVTAGVLGSENGLSSGYDATSEVSVGGGVTIDAPVTNLVRWTPIKDFFLDSPCVLGVAVRRNAGVAPDTGAAAAYILGVALERIGDR